MMCVVRRSKSNRHVPVLHQTEGSIGGFAGGPHHSWLAQETEDRVFPRVHVRLQCLCGHSSSPCEWAGRYKEKAVCPRAFRERGQLARGASSTRFASASKFKLVYISSVKISR